MKGRVKYVIVSILPMPVYQVVGLDMLCARHAEYAHLKDPVHVLFGGGVLSYRVRVASHQHIHGAHYVQHFLLGDKTAGVTGCRTSTLTVVDPGHHRGSSHKRAHCTHYFGI